MQQLINTTTKTMSSLEIAELTQKDHADVLKDIRRIMEEAEIDHGKFSGIYKDSMNREQPCYNLPRRECDLIVSGYNVKYRLAIIDRWQELEATPKPALPTTYIEALEALMASEKVKAELTAKNSALATALDQEFGYCSILRAALFLGISEKSFSWRKLKAESLLIGYPAKRVPSPRYGYQNLYPLQAFRNVYLEHDFEGLTPDKDLPEQLILQGVQ